MVRLLLEKACKGTTNNAHMQEFCAKSSFLGAISPFFFYFDIIFFAQIPHHFRW